jgi:hypothetical protein
MGFIISVNLKYHPISAMYDLHEQQTVLCKLPWVQKQHALSYSHSGHINRQVEFGLHTHTKITASMEHVHILPFWLTN